MRRGSPARHSAPELEWLQERLPVLSRGTHASATGRNLLVRPEQSMERVPRSAKTTCDCFLSPRFNHAPSSTVSPCSVIVTGNSSLLFVKPFSGLTITVDSH